MVWNDAAVSRPISDDEIISHDRRSDGVVGKRVLIKLKYYRLRIGQYWLFHTPQPSRRVHDSFLLRICLNRICRDDSPKLSVQKVELNCSDSG